MKDLETLFKSKPKVEDYDCQPYGYINALQIYIDKLEKQFAISGVVGRSEQLGCKFCGADEGLKHGYMPDGEPCPMDMTA